VLAFAQRSGNIGLIPPFWGTDVRRTSAHELGSVNDDTCERGPKFGGRSRRVGLSGTELHHV